MAGRSVWKERNTMTKEEIIEALEALSNELCNLEFHTLQTYKRGGYNYHLGLHDGYDIAEQRIAELLAKAKAAPEER
jgi:hypothetical protein